MTHTLLQFERLPSGIAGLDAVLQGGFLKGGAYIIQGVPGSGKTTLANQICFNHAKTGAKAVYVTLLSESHSRLLQHMRTMTFFSEEAVADSIHYVSGFSVLEQAGPRGLLEMVRREIRARDATVLVLDGLLPPDESAATSDSAVSQRDFKKFIHELQVHCTMAGCTAFMLTSGVEQHPGSRPEHTMVDGLVKLSDSLHEYRAERSLQIVKFRGSGFLRGGHAFDITRDGITVFPRTEALLRRPAGPHQGQSSTITTGIDQLDTMLHGGLSVGSTTMVLGPSGSGKTTIGLHFVSAATPEAPALIFGFYESPERLDSKAKSMGIDLAALRQSGAVDVVWQAPVENILDQLTDTLLNALSRKPYTRLFVDGFLGFSESAIHPSRVGHMFAALANELRARAVTTVYSLETRTLLGGEIDDRLVNGVSAIVENLLLLRFIELRAEVFRLLSILKVRDSAYDATLREFRVTSRGIDLEETFDTAKSILAGYANPLQTQEKKPPRRPTAVKTKARGRSKR